jgi:UDP-glucose 4-epimerase
MGRRVLVTGGAGFIGTHLVDRLLAGGDEVFVLDNLSRGRRNWVPAGARLYAADIREAESVRSVANHARPDVVVHLAALHFIPDVDDAPELARQVNVEGTRNLLQALAFNPPSLVLFASSAAIYPDRTGPIPESCPPDPLDVYGETKAEGERLVTRFAGETGTRCVIAHLFNVIGRRETNPHVVPELVAQVRRGRARLQLGSLESRRDYTDVTDVAEALALLLQLTVSEDNVFNIGSGRGVAVSELVQLCGKIVARELTVEVDPQRLRTRDRRELIANVALLKGVTGWVQTVALEQTLSELLLK